MSDNLGKNRYTEDGYLISAYTAGGTDSNGEHRDGYHVYVLNQETFEYEHVSDKGPKWFKTLEQAFNAGLKLYENKYKE